MLKKIYDKCVKWAGHKFANPILAIVSFAESFIFPIPTDAMIIPMVIAKKNKFFKIALIAIVFSVLGALIGYLIGYIFFNEIGIKIFEFFGSENANIFKEKLSSEAGLLSGILILFIAGFTPLPFKIITISSGFVQFNIILFIITCFVARGLRFFLVSYLTYKYGSAIGPFLEKKGGQWTVYISGIVVILALGFYFKFI
ncbi:MAG: membrane protein YqaA, SNARE-associated domain [Pelagibacterales bacterium]|nr:membrane protein YqaA, SNARE-associated domain [Pelagibacterales bacterium]